MLKFQTKDFQTEDFKDWDAFVGNHTDNNVFQTSEMFLFYKSVDNYTPFAIICRNEYDEIVGVILTLIIQEYKGLLGWFTSRAIIYGSPIVVENDRNIILNELLKVLVNNLQKEVIYIQFRNTYSPQKEVVDIFKSNEFKFIPWNNITVRTKSLNEAFDGLSNSKKRILKSEEKNDFSIINPANIEEVESLYNIFKEAYISKINRPIPSLSFFLSFYTLSLNNKLGIMKVAKIGNNIVGGYLSPVTKEKSIHEWYIIALDKKFKDYNISTRLTFDMITYSCMNNFALFDFMGAGFPDKSYGVRDFKLGFSKNIENSGRFEKDFFPMIRMFQKIALWGSGKISRLTC